jgi:hypothetical protein
LGEEADVFKRLEFDEANEPLCWVQIDQVVLADVVVEQAMES